MTFVRFFSSFLSTKDLSAYKKFLKKLVFTCVVIGVLYGIAATHIRFGLTATPSLPYRFFIFYKRNEPSHQIPGINFYVLFYHDSVHTHVIKQVKGLPGESLYYDTEGQLWVGGYCVGKPHATSRTGKQVNRIPPAIIPDGYVFVYAPHDRSFDSRYEEFGLIPIQTIQGVGVALV